MERTYYTILAVPESAPLSEIHQAYRRLVRLHHPDVSGPESTSRFLEIQQAWETLNDPERRRQYDGTLQRHRRQAQVVRIHPRPFRPKAEPTRAPSWNEPSGKFQATQTTPQYELNISPEEAEQGLAVTIVIPVLQPCPACGGWGHYEIFLCRRCGGIGCSVRNERFTLNFPAGLTDGMTAVFAPQDYGWLHDPVRIQIRVRS